MQLSHPGHNNQCLCASTYFAIQKYLKLSAAQGSITWSSYKPHLNDFSKLWLKSMTQLEDVYQDFYQKWGAAEIQDYQNTPPSNWPKSKAIQFFNWFCLTDEEKNLIFNQSVQDTAKTALNTQSASSSPDSFLLEMGKILETDFTSCPEDEGVDLFEDQLLKVFNCFRDKEESIESRLDSCEKLLEVASVYFSYPKQEILASHCLCCIIHTCNSEPGLFSTFSPEMKDKISQFLRRLLDYPFYNQEKIMAKLEIQIRSRYPALAKRYREKLPSSKINTPTSRQPIARSNHLRFQGGLTIENRDKRRLFHLSKLVETFYLDPNFSDERKKQLMDLVRDIGKDLIQKYPHEEERIHSNTDPLIKVISKEASKKRKAAEELPKRSFKIAHLLNVEEQPKRSFKVADLVNKEPATPS